MQISKLVLKLDQGMAGFGDIAGAARPGARARRRPQHCPDDLRVLPHAEIVVRAPDHDFPRAIARVPDRVRETAGHAFEIREHSIALLFPQAVQSRGEKRIVIHAMGLSRDCSLPQCVGRLSVKHCLSARAQPELGSRVK
jgi:hypothetical protein